MEAGHGDLADANSDVARRTYITAHTPAPLIPVLCVGR
jgi:hypothetical protein